MLLAGAADAGLVQRESMEQPIYLDHHSTTPCRREVVDAMLPYFSTDFGNPAAITHTHGRRASTAVEEARIAVADFLRVRPNEVFFTAGATESNNIALQSLLAGEPAHVVSSVIEHKSVLKPLEKLQRAGWKVTLVRTNHEGFVDPRELRAALGPETRLVSIIHASGEIGTIQRLSELAAVCREANVSFHTDATQAVAKVPIDMSELGADMLSLSAHKFYGPKGIGALIVRSGTRVHPLILGGGQEKKLRSGTVNVPAVVGMATALELRATEMKDELARLTQLRNELWDRIVSTIPSTTVHGPREERLPGNLNVTFKGIEAEALIHAMRRFSLSSGSACSSGDREPSSVLLAIGVSESEAMTSIRFGLGRDTTREQLMMLVEDLSTNVARLRELSVS